MELVLLLKDQAPHALPRGAFVEMTLKIGPACVKETSRSSTARPQEKPYPASSSWPGLTRPSTSLSPRHR
jgi:hypothetical protein